MEQSVPITGLDDKREITAVFASAADGTLFTPQFILRWKELIVHIHKEFNFLMSGT